MMKMILINKLPAQVRCSVLTSAVIIIVKTLSSEGVGLLGNTVFREKVRTDTLTGARQEEIHRVPGWGLAGTCHFSLFGSDLGASQNATVSAP